MKDTVVVNLRSEPYDVYIGRAGKGQDGYYGNPFSRKDCSDPIGEFRKYFNKRIEKDTQYRKNIFKLQGKRLGCFCKPRECHGDVIADFLNSIKQRPMTFGVVGGRNFHNYEFMKEMLSWFNIKKIVSGGAKGADSLAVKYAKENQLKWVEHLPDWNKYGKGAGFIRNALIVDDSEAVIAFWDRKTPGTKHTVELAEKAGKDVHIFWPDPSDDPIAELGL